MDSLRRNAVLFEITYLDPHTRERVVVEREFSDVGDMPARYWAEDYAYMLADKGPYFIKVLNK